MHRALRFLAPAAVVALVGVACGGQATPPTATGTAPPPTSP